MIQTLQKYDKLDEAAAVEKKIQGLEKLHEETEGDSQSIMDEDGDNEIEEDIEELLHGSGVYLLFTSFQNLLAILFLSAYDLHTINL